MLKRRCCKKLHISSHERGDFGWPAQNRPATANDHSVIEQQQSYGRSTCAVWSESSNCYWNWSVCGKL